MDAQGIVDRVTENLSVKRSFGKAYENGGTLVVPVALVIGGGGGGGGAMPPPSAAHGRDDAFESGEPPEASDHDSDAAMGGGGGFGGIVVPLGVYAISGDQVRWIPALDVTRIVLATLAMFRLVLRIVKVSKRR